jgi:hypothetical protein
MRISHFSRMCPTFNLGHLTDFLHNFDWSLPDRMVKVQKLTTCRSLSDSRPTGRSCQHICNDGEIHHMSYNKVGAFDCLHALALLKLSKDSWAPHELCHHVPSMCLCCLQLLIIKLTFINNIVVEKSIIVSGEVWKSQYLSIRSVRSVNIIFWYSSLHTCVH